MRVTQGGRFRTRWDLVHTAPSPSKRRHIWPELPHKQTGPRVGPPARRNNPLEHLKRERAPSRPPLAVKDGYPASRHAARRRDLTNLTAGCKIWIRLNRPL